MVEVTPQEQILQEEIPQKEIAALIDEALAQKIYKAKEDQVEALKKMGGCLSKLEETRTCGDT